MDLPEAVPGCGGPVTAQMWSLVLLMPEDKLQSHNQVPSGAELTETEGELMTRQWPRLSPSSDKSVLCFSSLQAEAACAAAA